MTLTQQLKKIFFPTRSLYLYLVLLTPIAILSFWKPFFSEFLHSPPNMTLLLHAHILAMFGWLLMLAAQAWFIRAGHLRAHRLVGQSSYIVAPAIILMGFGIIHQVFNRSLEGARMDVGTFGMVIAFAITWTLAIVYRKKPAFHIRFMISTAFALCTAFVFRIFYFWVPGFDSMDAATNANYSILIFLLLMLIVRDWKIGIKISPYWAVTMVHGIAFLAYWTFGNTEGWLDFCRWYRDLF